MARPGREKIRGSPRTGKAGENTGGFTVLTVDVRGWKLMHTTNLHKFKDAVSRNTLPELL